MALDRLGLQKSSLLDYPGRVAAVVFTHGCPLRCPYCHNGELISGPIPAGFVTRAEVMDHLRRRRALLGGVVITGGEPLMHADLPQLIAEVGAIGLPVKIDTCGAYPDRLQEILAMPEVDHVALDIKTAPEHYDRVRGNGTDLLRTIRILRDSTTSYHFRTTIAPDVVTDEDLTSIAALIEPGDTWVRQPYRAPVPA